jgi:hypothetical protein
MSLPTLHPPAPWRRVIAAQLRAVELTIRPSLVVAGVLTGVLATLLTASQLREGEGVGFFPEVALLTALAASVLPVAVWRGEYRFRQSYLASLPVDRTRHVLAKVAAGWVWLMGLTAAFALGMLALAAATGGPIGADEMRVLLSDLPADALPADLGPLARRWRTPGWHWAVFLTTATVTYLAGSAVVLAGSRVRRWLAGLVAGVVFYLLLAEQGLVGGELPGWVERAKEAFLAGRYGFLALFAETPSYTLTPDVGPAIRAWGDRPTPGAWVLTTLLWTGLVTAALLGVVRRDRA